MKTNLKVGKKWSHLTIFQRLATRECDASRHETFTRKAILWRQSMVICEKKGVSSKKYCYSICC